MNEWWVGKKAGVAKHGQRRKIQSLVLQRSASSNLVPCIFYIFILIYLMDVDLITDKNLDNIIISPENF